MKICRFNDNRVGIVEDGQVYDVTDVTAQLPALKWPFAPGDQLIAHLDALQGQMQEIKGKVAPQPIGSVKLLSPVANPSKIIAAPLNYQLHVAESAADKGIHNGVHLPGYDGFASPVAKFGVFLKSPSSIVGAGEGVRIAYPGRRNDHEVELAVIIGRTCKDVSRDRAFDVVAGYAIGLDMTVRGPEDRSYRKSADTYSVLGPYLVTKDEVADPDALDFSITVNGQPRQDANTRDLITGVAELIEVASRAYTLYPGDIIMTGTPEGVNSIEPGDVMHARIEGIGEMDVAIRA
jgi:2-keto-4-pentenoate hydratase/2-oxohepta-3-ene-1,7-dioic acid hydratase in catechol pathway